MVQKGRIKKSRSKKMASHADRVCLQKSIASLTNIEQDGRETECLGYVTSIPTIVGDESTPIPSKERSRRVHSPPQPLSWVGWVVGRLMFDFKKKDFAARAACGNAVHYTLYIYTVTTNTHHICLICLIFQNRQCHHQKYHRCHHHHQKTS